MEKKKIIFSTLFTLFVVIILFFVFYEEKEQPREVILNNDEFLLLDLGGYEVYEEESRYLIKNQEPFLLFEIPNDWSVDIRKKEDVSDLVVYSKEEGCEIQLSFYREKEELIYLQEKISLLLKEEIKRDDLSLLQIDNLYGYQVGNTIKVPAYENIFMIELFFKEDSYQNCHDFFSNFKKSISLLE
jgi:hypothetical protein